MINEPGRNPCSSTSMHQSTGRRIILRLVRDFLGAAKRLNHVEIVGAELAQHVLRRHELSIIVLNGLVTSDIADRSNGCVARLSGALGDRIGSSEDLCGLLIEEQVIVPEVGSRDVPVEIFCLQVDRIAVRQDDFQSISDGHRRTFVKI